MFNNVLVLSASAGAGHLRAAEALKLAFQKRGAAQQVEHVDTLRYTNAVFRHIYSKVYLDMVNRAPDVLGWLYDQMDQPYKNERSRLALNRLNTGPFVKMIKRHQPDLAVCTHFLPAEVISHLRRQGKLHCPLAVCVTDLDVHAMWLCHDVDWYFVALEETRVHLRELGVPEERVVVTGIPIDPVFAVPKDQRQMRIKHGLDPERVTLLLSAGGFGVGPIENLMLALLRLPESVQVVAICGRNEELKGKLEKVVAQERAKGAALPAVHVRGFTTEMDEFMAASDLLVGKPGGLTTSEALARGLVMVIVRPIPGQEERNADHLLEEGAAIRCNNLPALSYKVEQLLRDPARLERMRQNVRRLAKPQAAEVVVECLTSGLRSRSMTNDEARMTNQ